MARTRLNGDKRNILRGLAKKVVAATPISSEVEKRLKKAKKTYKEVHAKLVVAAIAIRDSTVSPVEEKVLKKFDALIPEVANLMFIDLESRRPVQVTLFNQRTYSLEHKPAEGLRSLPYIDREKYYEAEREATKACTVSVPNSDQFNGYKFTATKLLMKLHGQLDDAVTEIDMAERIDEDMRHVIMRDFEALIYGSKTFEDVVEVWPEAVQLTDRVCSDGSAITLVSDEAKARIMANMANRKVL